MSGPRDERSGASPLRDARLARALEHAPDAHLRPDPAVRAAVLAAARAAVAKPGSVRAGWRRWFGGAAGAGGSRMPWNAAFATLLIAGFVTLLWQDEPVPDARLDTPPAAPARPATPSAPPAGPQGAGASPSEAAPAEAPAAPAIPAPAPAPAPAPRAAAPAAQRAAPPLAAEDFGGGPEASRAQAAQEVEQQRARRAESSSAAPPGPRAARPAPSVAAPAPSVAEAAPSPAAPPPPAPAARAPAPMAAQRLVAGSAVPDAWTQLRIARPGAEVLVLERAQAGRLPGLLRELRDAGDVALPEEAAAPAQRIELRRGEAVLGTLELGGGRWRYQPLAGDAPERTGRLEALMAGALRDEIERLAVQR